MLRWILPCAVLAAGFALAPLAQADDAGQDDLDKAIELKLTADQPRDLNDVITLVKKALKAGLDDDNKKVAEQLLAGTLLQRAELASGAIFERPTPPPQWPQLAKQAKDDLTQVVEMDPTLAGAHFWLGRLLSLPGGDREKAVAEIGKAIDLLGDEPTQKAKALLIRASLSEDRDRRAADLTAAIELQPKSVELRQARAMLHLQQNEIDDALADVAAALELSPESDELYQLRGLALTVKKDFDGAKQAFDEAVRRAPNNGSAFVNRARLHMSQNDAAAALADLEQALRLEPRSLQARMLRARTLASTGKVAEALDDVEIVLQAAPGSVEAIELHAQLAANRGRFEDAVRDFEKLREVAPKNVPLLVQLGLFYTASKRAEKAVEIYGSALEVDKESWTALRGRADAYLHLGKQADAIADYERALAIKDDDSGILNNLAWVLATSPDEKIRNGQRAIELGKKACEITDYKQSHILSTLAAGYAETGDFDQAVQWSKKAVESGSKALQEQLSKELESYQKRQPWREEKTPDIDLPTDDDEPAESPGADEPADDAGPRIGANAAPKVDGSDDLP